MSTDNKAVEGHRTAESLTHDEIQKMDRKTISDLLGFSEEEEQKRDNESDRVKAARTRLRFGARDGDMKEIIEAHKILGLKALKGGGDK